MIKVLSVLVCFFSVLSEVHAQLPQVVSIKQMHAKSPSFFNPVYGVSTQEDLVKAEAIFSSQMQIYEYLLGEHQINQQEQRQTFIVSEAYYYNETQAPTYTSFFTKKIDCTTIVTYPNFTDEYTVINNSASLHIYEKAVLINFGAVYLLNCLLNKKIDINNYIYQDENIYTKPFVVLYGDFQHDQEFFEIYSQMDSNMNRGVRGTITTLNGLENYIRSEYEDVHNGVYTKRELFVDMQVSRLLNVSYIHKVYIVYGGGHAFKKYFPSEQFNFSEVDTLSKSLF